MKPTILLAALMLSACADFLKPQECVNEYAAYLKRPWCSETLTTDCKQRSVVIAANPIENEFNEAAMSWKDAHDKDAMTSDVATRYVTSKDTFCKFVDSIK